MKTNSLVSILQDYLYNCQLNYLLIEHTMSDIVSCIVTLLTDESYSEALLTKNLSAIDVMIFARDFCIGSDLTDTDKNQFYFELKSHKFFDLLSKFLYDNDFNLSSWTIYTFAKFSRKENVIFLETAYETHFYRNNPMLTARCLSELHCLGSKKLDGYLNQLRGNNDVISKFTLFKYWECSGDSPEYHLIIKDEELLEFISPDDLHISTDDIELRLCRFEQFFHKFSKQHMEAMTHKKFSYIASAYFAGLSHGLAHTPKN